MYLVQRDEVARSPVVATLVYVATKTRVVRARMTEADVEKIEVLARQRGMNSSEVIRDLVAKAVAREERLKIAASYQYLSGHIAMAVTKLVMNESPAALCDAFNSLVWGMDLAKNFPTEQMKAEFRELLDLTLSTEEDRAHPEAHARGAKYVRALRMSADDKARFKTLLLDLDSEIRSYTRW